MKNSGEIFLCHAKADKGPVRELYHRLLDMGLHPWLDEENLLPGQDWREEIEKAIRRADYFLACLSKSSVDKRGFVQAEIRIALDVLKEMPEGKTFLIPVRLEECDVPPSLTRQQWVDLFDDTGLGFLRLLWAIGLERPEYTHRWTGGSDQIDLGARDSVDYSRLREMLREKKWEKASAETRSILLYLAGHQAASRRLIESQEQAARIPGSHLHTIRRIWDDYGSEGIRRRFPRFYIPRDSTVENGLLKEMHLICDRFLECGMEPFIWFMRSGYLPDPDDEEVSYGPGISAYLHRLQEESPQGYDLLCCSSFFASWYPIPPALVLGGASQLGPNLSSLLTDQTDREENLNSILAMLSSHSLVYGYDKADVTYRLGGYVGHLVRERMKERGTHSLWIERTIRATDKAIPLPWESTWPPDDDVAYQAERLMDWQGPRTNDPASFEGIAYREEAASLCLKLAAYGIQFYRVAKRVGWKREATERLEMALELLGEQHHMAAMIRQQQAILCHHREVT
jgi:hypothetical protein